MVRTFLVRGMLAGLLAGLAAFVVGSAVGEPTVDAAIAVEEAGAAAHSAGDEHAGTAHAEEGGGAVVSRTLQRSAGLLTATGAYGLAVGGLFGLVFAGTVGRLGGLGARASAALLAGGGFVAAVLVPFLKYPANPPAVGQGDTVDARTTSFLLMVALSLAVAVLCAVLGRNLVPRWGRWNAWIAAGVAYVAAVAVVAALMPDVDEVPADFPATLLYEFRVASLAVHVALWTTLGLVFGALTGRALAPRTARTARAGV